REQRNVIRLNNHERVGWSHLATPKVSDEAIWDLPLIQSLNESLGDPSPAGDVIDTAVATLHDS
ncbi:hypothetical protein HAX54_049175, partial [Datura stramonium]|nr:hypothetical protein [Datura stramonium]